MARLRGLAGNKVFVEKSSISSGLCLLLLVYHLCKSLLCQIGVLGLEEDLNSFLDLIPYVLFDFVQRLRFALIHSHLLFILLYCFNNSFLPDLVCGSIEIIVIVFVGTLEEKGKPINNVLAFHTRLLLTLDQCFFLRHLSLSKGFMLILVSAVDITKTSVIHSKVNVLLGSLQVVLWTSL